MVSKCYLCGGSTTEQVVTAENWWGEHLTLIKNVPAWVCTQCGEKYFDSPVCKALDTMRKKPGEPTASLEVPVYFFRGLTADS